MKKYLSEFIGTFLLVSTIIGSGIMAQNLSNGIQAVALLGNTIATGAILFVVISMFAPISGAHFNPIVSFVFFFKKEIDFKTFFNFSLIQIVSGLLAVLSTHFIFEINIFQVSTNDRGQFPLLLSEIIATAGLILTILHLRENGSNVAIGVALFITAGYWFTSSTSFANPAVTISRIFTNTFTGIAPISVPYFIIGQIFGALLGKSIFNFFKK